ncbi:MAG: hypothetical protein LBO66_12050 [Deltaproteobacteria bacterium]|jgi:hypothetical protein|nr:hypothetical protein [Deltaproteobacteria bacterium]
MAGFIRYSKHKSKDRIVEYAAFCVASRREGPKKNFCENLGLVIDKQNGVFKNRARGTFIFTLQGGYKELREPFQAPKPAAPAPRLRREAHGKNQVMAFGEAWIASEILKRAGLQRRLEDSFYSPKLKDALLSLITYKLLGRESYYFSHEWWKSSYAQLLYPHALLEPQKIHESFQRLGAEDLRLSLLESYATFVLRTDPLSLKKTKPELALVDSPLWTPPSPAGESAHPFRRSRAKNGARLVWAMGPRSHLPIFFQACRGPEDNQLLLRETARELAAKGFKIGAVILDGGQYSESALDELARADGRFFARLGPNVKLYADLVGAHGDSLLDLSRFVALGKRSLFIKKAPVALFGRTLWAFVLLDLAARLDEIRDFSRSFLEEGLDATQANLKLKEKGVSVYLANGDFELEEAARWILASQEYTEIFDVGPGNPDLAPLSRHGWETLRGHLLTSFFSSAARAILSGIFARSSLSVAEVFRCLGTLFARAVPEEGVIVEEPSKKVSNIISLLNLSFPAAES